MWWLEGGECELAGQPNTCTMNGRRDETPDGPPVWCAVLCVQIPLSVEHKKAVHDVMALEAQVTQAHARLRDEASARDQAERRAKVEQAHIQCICIYTRDG